jgi:hypothetical protein
LLVPGVISSSSLFDRLNQELIGRRIRCPSSMVVNRIVAIQLTSEEKTNANIRLDQAEKQTFSNRLMFVVCFDQRLTYLNILYSVKVRHVGCFFLFCFDLPVYEWEAMYSSFQWQVSNHSSVCNYLGEDLHMPDCPSADESVNAKRS